MSISSEVTRITNAKAAIKAAIEGKGVTVPDGIKLDGMAALIEGIEAGGTIRVEQGTVTFAEKTYSYEFVSDNPDIFIAYVETDANPVYSNSNFVWVIIQDKRKWSTSAFEKNTIFFFGYNEGTKRYYVPYKTSSTETGTFSSGYYNSILGAVTYKWYAIYGVSAV